MPWNDWQFWIVSMLAALGFWILVKPFIPRQNAPGDTGCPNCASSSAASKKSKRRVAITIERKRI